MAITWRDVAAPDFRGAAVIAGSANEAINNSIKGITGAFDRFGQQFVDKDTNAAIKASMGLNSIDTLDADRAAIVAGMGQDVDVTKLNQILQQRAEALQGAETFRRSGLTHDLGMQKGAQDITIGQQNIDSGIAAALRQPVLNNQADELFSLNKQKGQLEVDYLPTEQRNKTAESRASVNQSNASAGASGASANLSNAQIKKLQTEQADTNIIREGIAGFSLANADVKTLDRNKLSSLIAKDPRYAKHSRAILDGVLANRGDDLDKADIVTKINSDLAAVARATAGREAALKRGATFIPALATDRWYVADGYNKERRAKFEGMYATALQQGADEGKLGAFMLNEQSKNDEYFNVNNNISPDEMQVKINAWMAKNYPPK